MRYRAPHGDGVRALKVLVACEFSGVVRRAFDARGHDVWSCDKLPATDGSNRHIRGDVRDHLNDGWDLMMVAHPPCTRLCNSGVRWLSEPPGKLEAGHYDEQDIAEYARMDRDQRHAFMWQRLDEGCALFSTLWNAPIPRIAIENPVMHKHAKARIENYAEFTQSVQPWQFGDPETKRTCWWLRNLPALVPAVREKPAGVKGSVWLTSPGVDRWKIRSTFFPGMAAACADQWGGWALEQERLAA
jgi:hypothetical protein